MYILGINAYHGDASAAIIREGKLIAAVEEERFNRIKHCAGFPTESVRYCLAAAGIGIADVEHIGISRDPSAHLYKKIMFAATRAAKEISNFEFRLSNLPKSTGPTLAAEGTDPGGLRIEPSSKLGTEGQVQSVQDSIAPFPADGNGRGAGFFRQLKDRLNNAAKVRDLKEDLARALNVSKNQLRAQFHNVEHHRAHLASSFFVSPFERAALLSIDGFGDFISTMWAIGEGNNIKVLGQVEYPHSTGIVYTATTQFLGFPHYGDEGKVMGLAPYGKPRYIEEFRQIIRTEKRGQFRLNLDYFRHHSEGVDMTWDQGSPVIGRIFSDAYTSTFGPPREQDGPLTDRERDIAASLQLRLEEVGFHILNHLHEETRLTDLGLSGGVAYNSVLNGKILLHTPFRRVFVQPAAGDSGTALGVCYQIDAEVTAEASAKASALPDGRATAMGASREAGGREQTAGGREQTAEGREQTAGSRRQTAGSKRQTAGSRRQEAGGRRQEAGIQSSSRHVMEGAYTGPEFTNDEIRAELETSQLEYETYTDAELTKRAAQDIADGLVVGWFQGRMEFGPRALGNRSIVVDPRRADMKEILNERIKKREPFRPFAPSILEEHTETYFEQNHPAPTMLMVYRIRPERRKQIPAVTHVDGSGRLQTVTRSLNPRYYQLIADFYALTGVPVVLNTSFNENEPIVCTPRHAINCFLKTRMDALYLGNQVVRRKVPSDE